MPTAEECSLGRRLQAAAAADPERPLLVLEEGTAISCREVHDEAGALAAGLASLGVAPGDRVLVWLPTSRAMVRTIFALSALGATIVPLNPALRGSILAQLIAISDATVMICHPQLVERLRDVATGGLRTLIVAGETDERIEGLEILPEHELARSGSVSPHLVEPWDMAAIIFSSGTTGPSKGVRVPAAQLWTLAQAFYGYMRSDDRMLLMYPLFHIAGFSALFGVINAGASMAVTEAFSATEFWSVLRRTGSTTTPGLGPTFIDILSKPEQQQGDADNRLRHVNVQAITPAARAFAARFGCTIMGSYSMTETSGICVSEIGNAPDGAVGRPRDGVQIRIVDGNDIEVPAGEPGELILRVDLPWTVNAGYHGNGEATAAAWRNGWFHTGDVVRQDADGYIRFVDRKKDVIRRRSENISSAEIEAEVRQFPAVQDAAAIGVDSPQGEEVLIAVSPVPGRELSAAALIEFLIPRLPHHMVPRFVRILPALPKTHTNRVQKDSLREAGLAPDSWDREASGIRLRGQRLS